MKSHKEYPASQPLSESSSGGSLNGLALHWTYDTGLRRDSLSAKNVKGS